MAQYIVTDTELKAIADTIRAKLESSDSLEWPSGFADAIDDISGGGGEPEEPFIESQGITYINTGIEGNGVYGIEIEFIPITCVNDYQVYAECSTNVFTIASMAISAGVTSGYIRCGNVDFGIVTFIKGEINKIECKNGIVVLNDTQLSGSYSGAINSDATTLKLFGSNLKSHARIYRCKLYDANGNITHDLIPHKDNNYIPCIYDSVTDSIMYGVNNRLTYGS